jgi:TPR repeat protein
MIILRNSPLVLMIASTLLLAACATSTLPENENLVQWQEEAQAGKANAQFKLGADYASRQEYVKALEWLQKSANQGNAPAQNALSVLYLKGLGVVKDDRKALDWLQKSAVQGYPKAQYNLAILYKNGRVVAKNETQAAAWLQQAALQGDVKAQTDLGIMYELGIGVPKNTGTAMEWLQKAANQGDVEAKNRLGSIYVRSLDSQ